MLDKDDLEKSPLQLSTAGRPQKHRTRQLLLLVATVALAGCHAVRFFSSRDARLSSAQLVQPQVGSIWWSQCPDDTTTYCSFLNVPLGARSPSVGPVSAPARPDDPL